MGLGWLTCSYFIIYSQDLCVFLRLCVCVCQTAATNLALIFTQTHSRVPLSAAYLASQHAAQQGRSPGWAHVTSRPVAALCTEAL